MIASLVLQRHIQRARILQSVSHIKFLRGQDIYVNGNGKYRRVLKSFVNILLLHLRMMKYGAIRF